METKKEFIQVFSEIGVDAFGQSRMNAENEAQNLAYLICYGMDALNEFGGVSDFRTAYLMQCIKMKFDPKDNIGKEVHEFIDNINTLVIQSNRYVWDFGKISTSIKKLQKL